MIDLLSILPYWIDFIYTTTVLGKSPFSSTSASSTFIRCLRLLRILKAEKYTHAFTVFDDVILANSEVLVVTGFSAMVMWKRTPGTPMGRNNATSGVGGSNNASSGSFRSRAAILDRGRTLPELLEQTRQDLYYKDKESRDYVNHDSAIGNQRLSRRKNAPTGVKW